MTQQESRSKTYHRRVQLRLTEKVWKPMRVRTDKTERLSATKCGLQGRRTTGERRSSMEEHPVQCDNRDAHRGKEPVSVDLSSPAMRTLVKNSTGRPYLKQMNQFHNHGIRPLSPSLRSRMESHSSSHVKWEISVGGSRQATVRSSVATSWTTW
jgi:hypothetical protein